MWTIERTSQFKRDYKREMKGRHRDVLGKELIGVLQTLSDNEPLTAKFRDHALTGDWQDHRDCHLKSDLLLIYRFPDTETFQLVRLGSHSELGL